MAQPDTQRLVAELLSKSAAPPPPHHIMFHPRSPIAYALLNVGPSTTLVSARLPSDAGYEPAIEWEPLLQQQPQRSYKLSKEELLLRERMRTVEWGITAYHFNNETCQFLVHTQGDLLVIDVSAPQETRVSVARQGAGGPTPMDAKLSPDGKLVSFVSDGDLWIRPVGATSDTRLTDAHIRSKNLYAAESKFVMQEEFDLYSAYWWSPRVRDLGDGRKGYEALLLEEDEAPVVDYTIAAEGYTGTAEVYKYPLTGTPNTAVSVALVRLTVRFAQDGSNPVIESSEYRTLGKAASLFPWVEYVPRAGWTQSGDKCWLQLLDRKQQHLALVTIPPEAFGLPGQETSSAAVQVVVEETSETFVNVTGICHPLKDGSFFWASERTGFRQLYIISAGAAPRTVTATKSGDEWIVHKEEIWVDEERKLVYFLCTRDSPLQMHLYSASFAPGADPTELSRITESEMDCEFVAVRPESSCGSVCAHVAAVTSNLHSKGKKAQIYTVSVASQPAARCTGVLKNGMTTTSPSWPVQAPDLFSFISPRHGRKLYGCIYRPQNFDTSKKYPTIVDVYGGPHVQQVRENFDVTARQTRQLYIALGFIVIVVDNSGSDNRGLSFESALYAAMGTVEAQDQADAVEYLRNRGEPIDSLRVAIMGWSYGGYTSLMALANHGNVFKVAISGAPVTIWEAYDTGYTERYMGLPQEQKEAYHMASVVARAQQFPNEDGRLLILHGLQDENVHFAHSSILVDALITQGKPHRLHVFPGERHGVRQRARRLFLEQTVVDFLLNHL